MNYMHHIYGSIDEVEQEKRNVKMMNLYDPQLPLEKLTKKMEHKGILRDQE